MRAKQTTTKAFGLGWPLIVGLALLPLPRAIGHDLHLLHEKTVINSLLAIIPLVIWIAVVLARRVRDPFRALLVVGTLYGFFLATTHQITWVVFWGDQPPHLGGNLAGILSPYWEAMALRFAACLSSIITGIVTGAIIGGLTVLVRKVAYHY